MSSASLTQQTAQALSIAKQAGMTAYLYVAESKEAPPDLQWALKHLCTHGYLVVDQSHNIVGHCVLNRSNPNANISELPQGPKLKLVVNNG